jgi:hypothetical protein
MRKPAGGARNRNRVAQQQHEASRKGPPKYITEHYSDVHEDGSETMVVTARSRAPKPPEKAEPFVKKDKFYSGGKVRGDGICQRGKTKGRFV